MAVVKGAEGVCGVSFGTAYIRNTAPFPTGKWGWMGTMPYGRDINLDRLYGEKPQAGSKDALGNRSCYHLHYTGQATLMPEDFQPYSSQSGSNIYAWIGKTSNPSRRLIQMTGTVKGRGGPPSLCGGRLKWQQQVGREYSYSLGLAPRYYIQSIEVEASCTSGKVVAIKAKVVYKTTNNPNYKQYFPESGTATATVTLNTDRRRSATLSPALRWNDVKGNSGLHSIDIVCSVTSSYSVGQVDPKLAWIQSRGILAEWFTIPSLILAHGRARDEKLPDLAVKGMNHLQEVTINSLAYTRDLTRLRKDARGLIKTLRKIKNPRSWPDLWLNYRYGFRLFFNDTVEIVEAAKRYRKRRAYQGSIRRTHSSSSSSTVTPYGDTINQRVGLTIYSDERSLSERSAIHAASSLDLLPSLNNVWDFVPYSFVVDWVVPVGDYLERLDTSAAIWSYPIRSAVVTVRSDLSVTLPPNWGGAINYTLFTRTRYSQAQLSRRAAQLPSGMLSGLSLKHGIDTLCLAVQRFKR